MVSNSQVIGGKFIVKFGTVKVVASEYSSTINPVTVTPQVASDGIVYTSETPEATEASMTLLLTAKTDKQALLDFFGDIKVMEIATGKLETLYGAKISGGINHDRKAGTGTCSIIAQGGSEVKAS